MRSLVLATAAFLALAPAAHAATVFFDDFDDEIAGNVAFNYAGFDAFDVFGRVDLVSNGYAGLSGDGLFVDLAGTPGGPGANGIFTGPFSLEGGERVTLSFDASGNQRFGSDILFAGFGLFDGLTGGEFEAVGLGTPFMSGNLLLAGTTLQAGDPYQRYSLSFTATSAGTYYAGIGEFVTLPFDFFGPLVDNVGIDQVPEPAAVALFGLGLLALGAARRRR